MKPEVIYKARIYDYTGLFPAEYRFRLVCQTDRGLAVVDEGFGPVEGAFTYTYMVHPNNNVLLGEVEAETPEEASRLLRAKYGEHDFTVLTS